MTLSLLARPALGASVEWSYSAVFETVVPVAPPHVLPPGASAALLGSLGSIGVNVGGTATGSFTIDDAGPDGDSGPNSLQIADGVVAADLEIGALHVFGYPGAQNVFGVAVDEPGVSDFMILWRAIDSSPTGIDLRPWIAGMTLFGGDLSPYVVLPFPAGPPDLATLDPYHTPVDIDDLVTAVTLNVDYDVDPTAEGSDWRQFQLVFRLTSLEAVPEPAVATLLGVAAFARAALRRRRSS